MELSSEQLEAVNAGIGFWKVEAAAGAGKTRVIVERFKRLIEEGVPKSEMLSLTFTRSAADEMYARTEIDKAKRNGRGGFRTFHSFALRLLLAEQSRLPFKLAEEPVPTYGQIKKTIGEIIRRFPLLNYKQARQYIGLQKRRGIFTAEAIANSIAADLETSQLARVYAGYEHRCREEGWLDFDSMTIEALRLLASDVEVRDRYQFRFVQCDEFQDCDYVQVRILQLISERHGNIFVVGDINQCVYAWRGAAPEILLGFEKLFPYVKTLYLGQNFRSTPELVNFARGIAPVVTPLVEKMRSENGSGPEPAVKNFVSDLEEAMETVWSAAAEPGTSAILARTNKQLRAVEDAAIQLGCKYHLLGRSGFWQRSEIQDLVAFARIVEDPLNDKAAERVILSPYKCAKYLGKTFLEKLPRPYLCGLRDYRNGWQGTVANALGRFLYDLRRDVLAIDEQYGSAETAVGMILNCAGMLDHYAAEEEPDETADNRQVENLLEALRVAGRYRTLGDFIAHADRAVASAKSEDAHLTLGTIHAAKGREWDNVFLIGVSEGILPHRLGDVAEEARIFYVGATRAARCLQISYFGKPSVFLQGLIKKEGVAA